MHANYMTRAVWHGGAFLIAAGLGLVALETYRPAVVVISIGALFMLISAVYKGRS